MTIISVDRRSNPVITWALQNAAMRRFGLRPKSITGENHSYQQVWDLSTF
jgi:hypothetical protein